MMTVTVILRKTMPSPGRRRVQGKKDVPTGRGRAGQVDEWTIQGQPLPRAGGRGPGGRVGTEGEDRQPGSCLAHALAPTSLIHTTSNRIWFSAVDFGSRLMKKVCVRKIVTKGKPKTPAMKRCRDVLGERWHMLFAVRR